MTGRGLHRHLDPSPVTYEIVSNDEMETDGDSDVVENSNNNASTADNGDNDDITGDDIQIVGTRHVNNSGSRLLDAVNRGRRSLSSGPLRNDLVNNSNSAFLSTNASTSSNNTPVIEILSEDEGNDGIETPVSNPAQNHQRQNLTEYIFRDEDLNEDELIYDSEESLPLRNWNTPQNDTSVVREFFSRHSAFADINDGNVRERPSRQRNESLFLTDDDNNDYLSNGSSSNNNPNIPAASVVDDDDDDDVILTGSREVPDIEFVREAPAQSPITREPSRGFHLFTPGGQIFVPGAPTRNLRSRGVHITEPPTPSILRRDVPNAEVQAARRQATMRRRQEQIQRRFFNGDSTAAIESLSVGRDDPSGSDSMTSRLRRRPTIQSRRHRLQRRMDAYVRLYRDHFDNSPVMIPRETLRVNEILARQGQYLFNGEGLYDFGDGSLVRETEALTSAGSTVRDRRSGRSSILDMMSIDQDSLSNREDIPDTIMRMIQMREQEAEDERTQSRSQVAELEKVKKSKDGTIPVELEKFFTCDLGKENHCDVCVLCGVELLKGIPEDYNTQRENIEIDTLKNNLMKLIKLKFKSPYIYFKKFNEIDIGLSKKVFVRNCGHVYCGRCKRNIMTFKNMTVSERKRAIGKNNNKMEDKYQPSDTDFSNVKFTSQLTCAAEKCTKNLSNIDGFVELYL